MLQDNDKQMTPRPHRNKLQGGSNMTGTDLCVNKPHKSRSYLNHLVFSTLIKYRLPFGRIPAYLREYVSVMPTVA